MTFNCRKTKSQLRSQIRLIRIAAWRKNWRWDIQAQATFNALRAFEKQPSPANLYHLRELKDQLANAGSSSHLTIALASVIFYANRAGVNDDIIRNC